MSNLTREAFECGIEHAATALSHFKGALVEYDEHIRPLIICARKVVKDPSPKNLAELKRLTDGALL